MMCNCVSRRLFISRFTSVTTGLATSLALGAMIAPQPLFAQNADAIRTLNGKLDIDAFKSGKAARLAASKAQTIFAIGDDAFLTDANFEAEISLDDDGVLNKLKVLSGQTLAVLKPRTNRATDLLLPNATGSIRGTGFYVNVDISAPHDYICCCYGHIAFQDARNGAPQQLKNSYHNATAIDESGDFVTPAYGYPYGHYDDELVLLEKAVNRTPHWTLPDNKMHFPSPHKLPSL